MAENKKLKYDEEFKKSIVQLYKDGVSKSSISKEHGVSQSTLNNWIKKYSDTDSTVDEVKATELETPENTSIVCCECGKELLDGSKFCSFCGAKQSQLEEDIEPTPTTLEKEIDAQDKQDHKSDLSDNASISLQEQKEIEQEELHAPSTSNIIKKSILDKVLELLRQQLTKDAETKKNARLFQVSLVVLCVFGFGLALLLHSWKAFVIALFQLGLIGTSFAIDKGIVKTDKINLELIPGMIAVLLILPYIIGLFSVGGETGSSTKKDSNIDWTQIELAEVLPTPTSTSGYIETDSMYGFEATLDAVLPEQYDAYIDKCKDTGFDVDIETGVLEYKAYNDDGYRLELSYSKSTEQLEIILVAPESMEDLVWNDLRISKILPEPKSFYGDVAEEDEVTEITLGKMTKEDLKEYVNACKEKGFDLEPTETATTYRAKNKEGYILECKYNGGNIVKISIAEPLFNIKLELTCRENLWFSKYDVEVFVDGESLGYMDHGATKTFDLKLKAGKYELRVCEKGYSSVDGTYTFLVAKDQTKKYKIWCSSDQISIEKNEPTTTKAETTKAKSTTTTTENPLNATLEKNFPRKMAIRAVVVAMTNGSATDVFKSDGNTYDTSKFHSYDDTTGFYLTIDESGVWEAKDDKTWHVDNMILDLQGDYSGTSIKVSSDVSFDGSNYVLSSVTKVQANSKYINSNDPYKISVEELEPKSSTPYLTVSSKLVEADRQSDTSASDDFDETVIIASAKRVFEDYGERCYPYGFECHWVLGRIATEVYNDGTCYIKVEVTITNQYGVEVDAIAEGKVNGNAVSDFYVS